MAHIPSLDSHVTTEKTLIDFTPAESIFSQASSSIISFLLIKISPLSGFLISSAEILPNARSDKLTKILPPSIISERTILLLVPQ